MSGEGDHVHGIANFVGGSFPKATKQLLIEYGGWAMPDLLHIKGLGKCQQDSSLLIYGTIRLASFGFSLERYLISFFSSATISTIVVSSDAGATPNLGLNFDKGGLANVVGCMLERAHDS